MIVYAALDEMHFVNRKLDANHMLPPYAWPPPSANMRMLIIILIHMIEYAAMRTKTPTRYLAYYYYYY